MTALTYCVEQINPLTDKVLQVFLAPQDAAHIHYAAGQYIEIEISSGEKRPFSIANAPLGSKRLELHIRHIPDEAFSQLLIADLRAEKSFQIHGPAGNCTKPDDLTKPLVFIAGGTGFAPIKAIIEDILTGDDHPPITLFWGARTEADLYLDNIPKHWASHINDFTYIPVLTNPIKATEWSGAIGLLHDAVSNTFGDLSQAIIIAAGPFEMVTKAYEHLQDKGVSRANMFSDMFEFIAE